ncbi:MAG: hypothetical protein HN405_06105 [Planctomycetes bacterium]|nr:hypothetical protein [Planctomycetota bacterium]
MAFSSEAIQLLRECQTPLIAGHLRADGDCLGSAIALSQVLRDMGKEPQIMMPDEPDGRYGFLAAHTPWLIFEDELPEHDLFIVCDCSVLPRLGRMGEAIQNVATPRLVIDHHPLDDPSPWTALIHDPTAAASGLLIYELAQTLGVPLNGRACEAAFTALMTDTGWLKYSNADARCWGAAADLVAGGLDSEKIYRQIYQQNEPGRPRGVAAALANHESLQEPSLALAWVSQGDLQESGGTLEDTDDVLDLMRAVSSVEAVALVVERKNGVAKVSFRSKTWLDVNLIAKTLGGGGHARAAGATFDGTVALSDAVHQVRKALLDGFSAQKQS